MTEQETAPTAPATRVERIRLHPLAASYLARRCGAAPPRAKLAERWHVSPAAASRWLRGKVRMPRTAAEDLAALAGVPLDDLLEPPTDKAIGVMREPSIVALTPILLEYVRADLDHALGTRVAG